MEAEQKHPTGRGGSYMLSVLLDGAISDQEFLERVNRIAAVQVDVLTERLTNVLALPESTEPETVEKNVDEHGIEF